MDVSQLQYTLEKAGGYGYKNVGFILDRGILAKKTYITWINTDSSLLS